MMMAEKHIHYFTNLAPHYRNRLWQLLAEDGELGFNFYFGKPNNNSIKEINFNEPGWNDKSSRINHLKNRKIFDRIVWQSGILATVIFRDIRKAVFLGDMNLLSTWIAAIILRLKGSRIYFWGHGFSGNEPLIKKYLRIFFNKLAHQHFLYGERARDLMVTNGFPASDLHLIYNSLDYENHKKIRDLVVDDSQFKKTFRNNELPVLVFIGRLTPVKKLEILLQGVHLLNKDTGRFNLLIIGDGPMRDKLERMAEELLHRDSYYFYGSCYSELEIGKLLSNSDLCVSPGNVGLTAIHSLSFGTPVCSHSNFGNQMPEFEAIEPGRTGFFFKENDVDDLVFNITQWFDNMESRDKIREMCYKVVDNKYNPEYQLKVFKEVLLK